jgi:NAD+ synthase
MICEDMWVDEVPECLMDSGADVLLAINGSPYERDKTDMRLNRAVARVIETGLPLIYLNQVGGQDELVFDGASFVLGADRSLPRRRCSSRIFCSRAGRKTAMAFGSARARR